MKKQLAVVMAAATAITTVAPAVVNADVIQANDTEAITNLKKKVADSMRLKYVDNTSELEADTEGKAFDGTNALKTVEYTAEDLKDSSVYLVQILVDKTNNTEDKTINCETYSKFEENFDNAYTELNQGEKIKIVITSKSGYRELSSGSITNAEEAVTYESDDIALKADGITIPDAEQDASKVGEYDVTKEDDGNLTYKIKLSDYNEDTDRFVSIKAGDKAFNTEKPILKVIDGFYVDEDGHPILEQEDDDLITLSDGVVSVKDGDTNEERLSESNKPVVDSFLYLNDGVATGKIIRDAVQKDVETFEIKAEEFYDINTGKLTQKANDLLYKLEEKHDFKEVRENKEIIYQDGNENEVAKVKIIKSSGDKDGKAYTALTQEYILGDMANISSYNEVVDSGYGINYLVQAAGQDRYSTAVQVARAMEKRENYLKTDSYHSRGVNTVILVSGDSKSMVDGLTAAPYAHLLQSSGENGEIVPVLLTKKDTLPESVVAYLKDRDVKTVKIIGGENSVSEKVVDQLKNDLVINDVDRFSGTDRFSTAMEVADEMKDMHNFHETQAFLVSGYATPDSLSVAGVAAANNAPILLTKKDEIPSDVKTFIEDNTNKTVNIIGGENSVSKNVVRTILADVDNSSINRVSGDDRQATNAEVIKEFAREFMTKNNIKQMSEGVKVMSTQDVIIARGDGNYLIDALAAGAYSGTVKASLVLTGANGMSKDQKDNLADEFNSVVQAGYAVKDSDADYLFDNLENPANGEKQEIVNPD